MSKKLHIKGIENALALLENVSADARLVAFKNLALNNGGRWDLPSNATRQDGAPVYEPLLISIEVYGVYAMSDSLGELTRNWILAAKKILKGIEMPTRETR